MSYISSRSIFGDIENPHLGEPFSSSDQTRVSGKKLTIRYEEEQSHCYHEEDLGDVPTTRIYLSV